MKDGLAVTKMQDRRAAIVERLADHVVMHGLSASSLRSLAKAAHTSDRMLLYYFKDKADIVAAALACVSSRLVQVMDERAVTTPRPLGLLRRELAAILLDDSLWPYMRLWLELASLSAHGDALFRTISEQIARGFLAWGAAQLDSATPEARAIDAAELLVTIEGLVLLKSVGLDDVCEQALKRR